MTSKELTSTLNAQGLNVRVAVVQRGRVHRVCPRVAGAFDRAAVAQALSALGYTSSVGAPIVVADTTTREVFAYLPGMIK